MRTPYKMKGYTYPGTSPAKQTTDPDKKVTTENWVKADKDYDAAKKGNRKDNFSKRYNTKITKKNGVWSNAEGTSVADLEKNYLKP